MKSKIEIKERIDGHKKGIKKTKNPKVKRILEHMISELEWTLTENESENEKCSLKWCKSGLDGTVRVNENIGDGCFRTDICVVCLKMLGLKEGSDLPDPSITEEKLNSQQ